MELYEGILSRRSIRKYARKSVTEETIVEILKAGMAAPSAVNCQPWHFVVLTDHNVMDGIPDFHPYSKMITDAAAAILVCIDKNLEHGEGYGILDCSAATQNLLLAAHAKGLGAVWLGIYPREARIEGIKNLLQLPDFIVPLSLISVGYPAEEKPAADRYDAKKVHYNKW